ALTGLRGCAGADELDADSSWSLNAPTRGWPLSPGAPPPTHPPECPSEVVARVGFLAGGSPPRSRTPLQGSLQVVGHIGGPTGPRLSLRSALSEPPSRMPSRRACRGRSRTSAGASGRAARG